VASCPRQRRHRGGRYCDAHRLRLRAKTRTDPGVDVDVWQRTEPPIGVGGQVSLRGLPALVAAQVLLGLQQRCRLDGVRTKEADLRSVCDDLRRQQVHSIADYRLAATRSLAFAGLVNALARHARRALTSPAAEAARDEWDLAVFGHYGTVSFTGITQDWLREAVKRWAIDDLPRRRLRPGRRTSGGLSVRHHVNAVARLSESLRVRADRGENPAALGRAEIETFLNRLAYLVSNRQISLDARIRTVREVRHVMATIRALGLTRPGGLAAGLGEDFTIGAADIPDKPEPAETGRDLPPEIMRQLCARLDQLVSTSMRTAIELAIDTGRRPEEICDLGFDCLAHEADGSPVLVFDNHKAGRLRRRLPIGANTAKVITAQQQRVQARYPHTPVGDLKLLPTDRRNPNGDRAITAFSLSFHHRTWVSNMAALSTVDDTEFDKTRVVLYAYRHTYAQRHADAGVPIDVLRELMDHRKLDTTSGYYTVGAGRRREAVDRVAAMQFNRHGERVWRQTQELLDSEHARRSVGEVVVPFGICAEPSNVQAGGNACPYRFRCVGCDHFRTDISYLPDLQAHLDDLLRNREKLLATQDLDDWARTEALPSDDEITRIRRLICKVEAGLDQLTPEHRSEIEQAVATVRRHRTVTLGMPRIRQPLPDIRPENP
jgi:integrase